jgi:hypothetical protein
MCEDVDEALNMLEKEEKRIPSTRLQPVSAPGAVKADEKPVVEPVQEEVDSDEASEEETPFSILAAQESSSTDAWILKNVQAILKKQNKEDKVEG